MGKWIDFIVWLIVWLIDWFYCFIVWLIIWLIDWFHCLIDCLIDWLILLFDWLFDWLIDWIFLPVAEIILFPEQMIVFADTDTLFPRGWADRGYPAPSLPALLSPFTISNYRVLKGVPAFKKGLMGGFLQKMFSCYLHVIIKIKHSFAHFL